MLADTGQYTNSLDILLLHSRNILHVKDMKLHEANHVGSSLIRRRVVFLLSYLIQGITDLDFLHKLHN